MAMAAFALGDDLSGSDIKCCKEGGSAVAYVIMSDSFDITQAHGQEWLGAVKSLDLALFVNAQYHGIVGRVEVKSHDIANLFDEEGVVGELEMALAVWRNAEGVPDAVDGGFGNSGFPGQGAATPVGSGFRFGVNCFVQERSHLFVGDGTGPSGTEFVMETLETLLKKALSPFARRGVGKAEFSGNGGILFSVCGQKHDLSASDQAVRHGPGVGQRLYLLMFFFA